MGRSAMPRASSEAYNLSMRGATSVPSIDRPRSQMRIRRSSSSVSVAQVGSKPEQSYAQRGSTSRIFRRREHSLVGSTLPIEHVLAGANVRFRHSGFELRLGNEQSIFGLLCITLGICTHTLMT